MKVPTYPPVFTKPADALAGLFETIPIHRDAQSQLDYEGELTIVIGKDAKKVTTENALDYVLGYTVGNDLSAVGVNTVEHIKAMPEALKVKLLKDEIDDIHAASPYSSGYPMAFTQHMQPVKYDHSWTPADNQQYHMSAWIDAPPKRLVSL